MLRSFKAYCDKTTMIIIIKGRQKRCNNSKISMIFQSLLFTNSRNNYSKFKLIKGFLHSF